MLRLHYFFCLLLVWYPACTVGLLTPTDRFSIFEQLSLHQSYIDHSLTCDNAKLYASLYWPEASFRVIGTHAPPLDLLMLSRKLTNA